MTTHSAADWDYIASGSMRDIHTPAALPLFCSAVKRSKTTCSNPLCTCSPCLCGDGCRCGTARLGELEHQVMNVLWRHDTELSARAVTEALDGYALTTIATVLGRLSSKGLVLRRHVGRFVVFSALETEAEHTAVLMREALVTAEDPTGAIVQFVRTATPAERRALRTALTAKMASRT